MVRSEPAHDLDIAMRGVAGKPSLFSGQAAIPARHIRPTKARRKYYRWRHSSDLMARAQASASPSAISLFPGADG